MIRNEYGYQTTLDMCYATSMTPSCVDVPPRIKGSLCEQEDNKKVQSLTMGVSLEKAMISLLKTNS